jgi:hypothetical protein
MKHVLSSMAPVTTCAELCSALGSIGAAGEAHADTIASSGAMALIE